VKMILCGMMIFMLESKINTHLGERKKKYD
jgi:hypothetical protein